MKKTTRVLVALLALTLVTSCFVGGTFAKYITTAESTDTARVAMFGVVLTAESDVFATEYAEESDENTGTVAVKSDEDTEDVIAPGTKGTMTAFTIEGAPEVDVKVTATLSAETALSMVTLPAAEYTNWTTADPDDNYETTAPYYPVFWTLKQDGAVKATGNLEAIQTYLTGTLSGVYEVEDNTFDALNGEWTLDWTWGFETDHDAEDTTLGQMAAGVEEQGDAILNETFDFAITVAQVD